MECKAAIRKMFTENQVIAWERRYNDRNVGGDLRDAVKDKYETRLDKPESMYENEKDRIEDSSLSKEVKKTKLKALKKQIQKRERAD